MAISRKSDNAGNGNVEAAGSVDDAGVIGDAGDTIEERRRKGRIILEQLTGSAVRTTDNYTALHPAFIDWVTEFALGQVWSRPGVDLRTRSLCTISALTALGRLSSLQIHIKGALGNGATEEEILETILHMAVYAGFPAAQDGLTIAREVFRAQSIQEMPQDSPNKEPETIEIHRPAYSDVVPGD